MRPGGKGSSKLRVNAGRSTCPNSEIQNSGVSLGRRAALSPTEAPHHPAPMLRCGCCRAYVSYLVAGTLWEAHGDFPETDGSVAPDRPLRILLELCQRPQHLQKTRRYRISGQARAAADMRLSALEHLVVDGASMPSCLSRHPYTYTPPSMPERGSRSRRLTISSPGPLPTDSPPALPSPRQAGVLQQTV